MGLAFKAARETLEAQRIRDGLRRAIQDHDGNPAVRVKERCGFQHLGV
jgi:hypothetical protein